MREEQTTGTGSMGARRATEDPVENPRRQRRFSARRKVDAVLRLLRGENLETLSRELGVAAHELSRWRDQFLASGQEAMKKRPGDDRDGEIWRLKTKVGDLTMDIELLNERLQRANDDTPLARPPVPACLQIFVQLPPPHDP